MDKRFGGLEGRRRGGQMSQITRRLDPEHYRDLGCNIPKQPVTPGYSKELAEFIGLVLGDGGLSYNQLRITLNSEKDLDYSLYVVRLTEKLFGLKVGSFVRKDSKCIVLYVSGVNLINVFCGLGLRVGNKVRLQVAVPEWVRRNDLFSLWCMRGLMDTDGGVFLDRYTVNGKEYCYKKVCFTNKSMPLISFVYQTLIRSGFHPKTYSDNKVWLYSYKEANRYLHEIGSSNQRLNLFKDGQEKKISQPVRIEAND